MKPIQYPLNVSGFFSIQFQDYGTWSLTLTYTPYSEILRYFQLFQDFHSELGNSDYRSIPNF